MKWSDGQPVTASDAALTINAIFEGSRRPATPPTARCPMWSTPLQAPSTTKVELCTLAGRTPGSSRGHFLDERGTAARLRAARQRGHLRQHQRLGQRRTVQAGQRRQGAELATLEWVTPLPVRAEQHLPDPLEDRVPGLPGREHRDPGAEERRRGLIANSLPPAQVKNLQSVAASRSGGTPASGTPTWPTT